MTLTTKSKKYKNTNVSFVTKETEYELISNWQKNKDAQSLARLLKAYNNFVKSIANRYLKYGDYPGIIKIFTIIY